VGIRRNKKMAEESNVHVKVAMADVLALFVIAMFTMTVTMFAFDVSSILLVVAIGPFVGILCIVAAVFAYLNENLLGTAIFGPLAVFFFTVVTPGAAGMDGAILCIIIGVIILIDALVAFFQPVKMLPILLLIAAVAFFVTALFYDPDTTSDSMKTATGALWLIYSLLSFYMAAAILMLVLKGKQVLPLMIKA
jgi:hypothetical protein